MFLLKLTAFSHTCFKCPSSHLCVLQIFPRNATETPALLSSIERNIAAATFTANAQSVPLHRRAGPTTSRAASPDAPRAAPQAQAAAAAAPGRAFASGVGANTSFQVYSKALDEFIAGFPTYEPLMREIKGELDNAVDAAVRCATENVELRRRNTEAQRARAAAVEAAYKKVRLTAVRRHAGKWIAAWICWA